MNLESICFPFGNQLQKVEQLFRSPKKVFILGVYSSAVHAKWYSADHKLKVRALAVASEPYIFWKGENADHIISGINVPDGAGYLLPADEMFNGPSGRSLDDDYLRPLKLTRDEVWLADMVPYSCLNPSQMNAIKREYAPLIDRYNLPKVTIERVPSAFTNVARIEQILTELQESKAQTIILLCDKPIQHFLRPVTGCPEDSLAKFANKYGYGQAVEMHIMSRLYNVIPLVHPRQAASLGRSDPEWHNIHSGWKSL